MAPRAVPAIVILSYVGGLPILLGNPLFDDSSDHLSGLSSINEDVHISKCNTVLEVQFLCRDSSTLVLDVLLFTMSHILLFYRFLYAISEERRILHVS